MKRSVAVVIRDREGVLIVKRPGNDEDLPNAWGLPAASLRAGETWEDAVIRAGREKLGVDLRVGEEMRRGSIERRDYTLEMRLYDAEMIGGAVEVPQRDETVTQYQQWKWGIANDLVPAAEQGSLCCRLYLESGMWL